MEKLIYTTSTVDEHRYSQLKVFLYTMWNNGGHYPLLVDLVNSENKDELKKIYPLIEINYITDHDISVERMMYIRPLRLQRLLHENHHKIISIDTDIIVRNSTKNLWSVLSNEFRIRDKGQHKQNHVRFNGGVIIFGNGDHTKKYYDRVIEIIGSSGVVYDCQRALLQAYNETGLKRKKLPKKYNDPKFNDDSIIWHCKHNHFHEKKYQKEYQYYLRKANGCLD